MVKVWRVAFLGTGFFWLTMVLVAMLMMPVHAGEYVRPSESGTLTIRVENVSPKGGRLRLGLYNAALYPDDASTPIASADVQARPGGTTIVLRGLPPGTYAIETFQDTNSNGRMDTSWLGLPLEPFGFSRDARPHFSKPSFQAVSFPVEAGDNEQTLHLQNSVALIAQRDDRNAGF
jgi:uncharacterized protein (DUF2141 family)